MAYAAVHKRTWQTKAGTKTAWVADWIDNDGKRHIKTFTRKGEAKEWLDKHKPAIKQGTHVADSKAPTLGEAAEAWIRRGEADQRERSTITQRHQHVELHILPMLGSNTKLSRLSPAQIDAFRDDLLRTRSRAMAKKVMTSFKSILRQQRMAHLTADVARIETNGRHKKRLEVGRDIPTPDDVRSLLGAATGYIRPLLAVAVFCGLRASEIRGLRWQDVDFDERRVHVRQRIDKWNTVGVPKSDTSYRSVPLAPFVVNTLKEWRLARQGDGLVFGNGAGNAESLANIWNRHLAPLQVGAGVAEPVLGDDGKPVLEPVRRGGKPVLIDGEPQMRPKMRARYGLHSFRHFYASWRLEQGDNVKLVSVRMGHSSPVVTLTLYSHLLPQEDEHERYAAGELALVGS